MVSIFSDDVQMQMKEELVESVIKTLSILIQENSTKRFLRPAEACEYMNISHNTLMKWVEIHKLPICSIDGIRLVDTHDLNALVARFKI